jgi:hypothetical protein
MGETIIEFEIYRQDTTVYFTISHQEDDYINISYQGNLTVIPNLVGLFLGETAFGILNSNSNPNNTVVSRTFITSAEADNYIYNIKHTIYNMSLKIMNKYKIYQPSNAKTFGHRCGNTSNVFFLYITDREADDPYTHLWGL